MAGSQERIALLEPLEKFLKTMLEAKGKPPSYKTKLPSENELVSICKVAGDILLEQDALLDLVAPITVIGDIQGQYHDLLRLFEYGGFPPSSNYLFLGNYVDRGKNSLEVMVMLLIYKVKFPLNFFLLRGNHECAAMTRIYGFYAECKLRYNIDIWKTFCDVFNKLPFCATIDEKIFCVHGGLAPELTNLEQIRQIARPTDVPDAGMLCDFLWGDPNAEIAGWIDNYCGVSYMFGEDVINNFVTKFDLDFIVRAHQVVEDGFEFIGRRNLITLFSAPNFCGEFDNAAAMLVVDESLQCSFKVLKPVDKVHNSPCTPTTTTCISSTLTLMRKPWRKRSEEKKSVLRFETQNSAGEIVRSRSCGSDSS